MMALLCRFCFFLPWIMFGLLTPAIAQVTTTIIPDGSLGTTVRQSGSVHTIDGGTIRGPNQFHSLDRFDVGTGDTASFTGPASLENILSRVTGGQQSMIDGMLQSDIAGANLYLLNPNGVMFGPNAVLDVQGSFHVSTADVLRFNDGVTFSASLGEGALTVMSPVAFGFLGDSPAPMSITESRLIVSEGEALSIIGGHITISGGGRSLSDDSIPNLGALSGQIHLVAVASPGEVILGAPNLNVASFSHLGEIAMVNSSFITASGPIGGAGGGTVMIRGHHLRLDSSRIFVDTLGDMEGALIGIDIQVQEDLALLDGALITTDTLGGDAGSMEIRAKNVEVVQGAIGSRAFNGSSGNTGDVEITAESVQVKRGGRIESRTVSGSRGNGGDVALVVDRLEVSDGGVISTDTLGEGDGGNVTIRASESATLSGSDPADGSSSLITAETGSSGSAGDVLIETIELST